MRAMEISRSALDVEWRRLEIVAENLANANGAGAGWQPRRLVSGPDRSFAAQLAGDVARGEGDRPSGVSVYAIETIDLPPRLAHEPGNPQADAQGMVAYPGVDHAAEMTLMVKTARVYEANIVALAAARQMYAKALELGQRA